MAWNVVNFYNHVCLKRMYILKLLNVLSHRYTVDQVCCVVQIFISLLISLFLLDMSVTEEVC